MPRARDGFTLIELLVVVVIIGLLAGLAIPRFTGVQRRAHVAAMAQDMRNLSVHQQLYYEETANAFTYAPNPGALPDFLASDGVNIVIEESSQSGWSARATHSAMPGIQCVVYHGDAAPIVTATGGAAGTPGAPGVIACDNP